MNAEQSQAISLPVAKANLEWAAAQGTMYHDKDTVALTVTKTEDGYTLRNSPCMVSGSYVIQYDTNGETVWAKSERKGQAEIASIETSSVAAERGRHFASLLGDLKSGKEPYSTANLAAATI